MTPQVLIGIDVGGTFTDFAVVRGGVLQAHKVLSTPDDPARAVLQGLRELGIDLPSTPSSSPSQPPSRFGKGAGGLGPTPLSASGEGPGVRFIHGSTVATNALLECKGARTALVATRGFEDVIEIGRQNRTGLYDFNVTRPEPLVPEELRFGATERVDSQGRAIRPLSEEEARELARRVKASGVQAVAVCLLFSFLNPEHEDMIARALEGEGAAPYVYLSSRVLPEYREYERASTTVVNACIAPVVHKYLAELRAALGDGLRIMQSSGGSVTAEGAMARPGESISGGPAAGVAGAFHIAREAGFPRVITFDMGGTSTDVALCPGRIPETSDWSLGGHPIRTPAIDVYSVGAGGGSIARLQRAGSLLVGPESVGADPGPACYGKGLVPAVTDANLVLGRLDTEGTLGGGVALQPDRARQALQPVARSLGLSLEEAAHGVVRVANAHMERAIRVISVERGHDPRDFTLLAFGGAGPMHACDLAESLGIPRVLVPLHPGVLSALGMTVVDIARQYSMTVMQRLAPHGRSGREDSPSPQSSPWQGEEAGPSPSSLSAPFPLSSAPVPLSSAPFPLSGERAGDGGPPSFTPLSASGEGPGVRSLPSQALADMAAMGVPAEAVTLISSLDMRYAGQSHELTIPHDGALEEAVAAFHRAHRERYGYARPERAVELVTVRLKAVAQAPKAASPRHEDGGRDPSAARLRSRPGYFGGRWADTPRYARRLLRCGNVIAGPALVLQYDCTTVIPPTWTARVDPLLNLIIEAGHVH